MAYPKTPKYVPDDILKICAYISLFAVQQVCMGKKPVNQSKKSSIAQLQIFMYSPLYKCNKQV